jgi:hypothetical protein
MLQFNYGTEANEDFGSRWKIIKEQEGLFNKIIEEFFFFSKRDLEKWIRNEKEVSKFVLRLRYEPKSNLNFTNRIFMRGVKTLK